MTNDEAITELETIKRVYANMRKEYKPCIEALQMAIDLLRQADTPQTETKGVGCCNECKWFRYKRVCGRCRSKNLFAKADDFCSYGSRSEKPNNSTRSILEHVGKE